MDEMPREYFTAERHNRRDDNPPAPSRNWDLEMMHVLSTLSRLEEKVEKISTTLPDPEQIRQTLHEIAPSLTAETMCLEKSRQELEFIYHAPAEKRLDSAAGELAAVIQTTEAATEEILSACEQIDAICHDVAASRTTHMTIVEDDMNCLQECVIRIYQAATFQDITGQRITKVSRILGDIENRIGLLANILGIASDQLDDVARKTDITSTETVDEEQKLLNGPAMPGEGICQSDIDAMFD